MLLRNVTSPLKGFIAENATREPKLSGIPVVFGKEMLLIKIKSI
jgi:hypothetical protein